MRVQSGLLDCNDRTVRALFADYIKADIGRSEKIIREANMRVD